MAKPKKVLFFAEAVTLAHVGRPIALASILDSTEYEVVFACSKQYARFFSDFSRKTFDLCSISSEAFLHALAKGRPVYDARTLRKYVEEDLRIIRQVEPDLVIGDFRLSLSVSCRLSGVPYATISNAYWSPFLDDLTYPVPVLPMTRLLPLPLAATLFNLGQPFAFKAHCAPLNMIRHENGLPTLGNDLRRVYTDADYTLYADTQVMYKLASTSPNQLYLGPILWSPPVIDPPWWDTLTSDKPLVYVTLGSSGQHDVLASILTALRHMDVRVMVAAAGASTSGLLGPNIYAADYLRGIEAARRSSVVICNGGSPTSHQAVAAGAPVLGIAGNMDQFMNMNAIVNAGVGLLLRADRVDSRKITSAVAKLLSQPAYRRHAAAMSPEFQQAAMRRRFKNWIDSVI